MLTEWLDYLRTGFQSTAGDSFFPYSLGLFYFFSCFVFTEDFRF